MKRISIVAALVVALAAAGGWAWWHYRAGSAPHELTLYGNVDLREVDLAFNNNERISEVLVQEGDHVRKGEVLARVDTSRLAPQVDQAAANLDLAKVNAANDRVQYNRVQAVWSSTHGRGISRQDVDNAQATLDGALAQVQANAAQLALLRQELADAVLVAPMDATVRSRLLEPGDMASPSKPVLDLAITDPKWVRVYVGEPDLGRLHPGMTATVAVDSFPDRRFAGWVGFISSVAEFTPKTVETTDLRPSLVYEVRVFVKDPGDDLRLGMPATVHITLAPAKAGG
ncbi:MAG: efflux RND transporter periplasmic adaptor subunit [Alphaproteobacteria bacterium]|nr:efflux RND transporter periplasmic adaptor subunit [Alphaproteobacteria bacterium]